MPIKTTNILIMNFLLAISTTVGMTIIPILITDSLGLSFLILGMIEGTTEFISNSLRLLNGVLFDKTIRKNKVFIYPTALAFISKTVLLFPSSWTILLAKIMERISNGAFAAPRDAYIAENSLNKGLGLSLISVSKTLGCILGPLLVSVSAYCFGNIINHINWYIFCCCCSCLIAVLFSYFVKSNVVVNNKFSIAEVTAIFKDILPIILLGSLFFLGRFNDGLLMMYLKHKGFPEWFYLSTIAIFNTMMLISSPFIGAQIDKGNSKNMLYLTISALVIFNLCFCQLNLLPWPLAITGLAAWGIQRTGAQIVFSALVFQALPSKQYGTGIGLFYITSGFATMLASFLGGYLANYNFSLVFFFSGVCAALALLMALLMIQHNKISYGFKC
jgi:MFS family permease